MASSALLPPNHDADASAVRPRNRRLISTEDELTSIPSVDSTRNLGYASSYSIASSRDVSPMPSGHIGTGHQGHSDSRLASNRLSNAGTTSVGRGFLGNSWSQSWASVQGLASSLLNGTNARYETGFSSSSPSSVGQPSRTPQLKRHFANAHQKTPGSWGPEPPASTRPRAEDIAVGSLADREASLKAARMASVLESHEGVNGGLDVTGRYKRRTSDETNRHSLQEQDTQEHLVYIHHVQPRDTYAGIVLKYKCHEDAFRKANGLWSRDNIQVRKWLALPVDACEIRGRPCEPPSYYSRGVDLLAPTPEPLRNTGSQESTSSGAQNAQQDFFSLPTADARQEPTKLEHSQELPWTHVRWVTLDGHPQPVEIGRVPRKAMGYFPPRRKKSIHTASTLSTPRQSLDLSSIDPGSADPPMQGGGTLSRRLSSLSSRPQLTGISGRDQTVSSRGRMGSVDADSKPSWMRRPGGVGSLSKSVRAPGPEKDYFNSWTRKHLPGLNIESLPSMSVMGSETANFGFKPEPTGIVESPFDEGQEQLSVSRQGTGLDRAAATVETWLRGAFAKRPSTPVLGGRARQLEDLDLIELADTNSDDGKPSTLGGTSTPGRLSPMVYGGASGRSDAGDYVRGRGPISITAASKDKKAD